MILVAFNMAIINNIINTVANNPILPPPLSAPSIYRSLRLDDNAVVYIVF